MGIERHIEIDRGGTPLVDALSEAAEISKANVKQAMTKGAVWVSRGSGTRRVRRVDYLLRPGDHLHLYYDEEILSREPASAELIADEGKYSVWFKPFGMLSQGSKWGDHCTIHRWVERHLKPQRPAFITHRLDRAATGLMVIAHGKTAAAQIAEQFRARTVVKRYRAIVQGSFPESVLLNNPIESKPATSHARLLEYSQALGRSLIEIEIETGRKHQIRRHLAEAGYPILGDRLYGTSQHNEQTDLCLVSCHVAFTPPSESERKAYTLPTEMLPSLR